MLEVMPLSVEKTGKAREGRSPLELCLSKKILTSWWTGKQAPPPLPPPPVFAKILRISGRKNCRETIFALENEIFHRENRPVPTVHAAGHDWRFERVEALSSFYFSPAYPPCLHTRIHHTAFGARFSIINRAARGKLTFGVYTRFCTQSMTVNIILQ